MVTHLNIAIERGTPTITNVDYRDGAASADGIGDHFIVIQGKTETLNDGKVTSTIFNFFDPGIRNKEKGASPNNTIEIINNRLEGKHIYKKTFRLKIL